MAQSKRICPVCNHMCTETHAQRKNKRGEVTAYVYCPYCCKKHHVYIVNGEVRGIVPRYNHKKSREEVEYEQKCDEEIAKFKAQQEQKINVYENSTNQQVYETNIPSQEEALEIIANFFNL